MKKYLVTVDTGYEVYEELETDNIEEARKRARYEAKRNQENWKDKRMKNAIVEIRTDIEIDDCGCESYNTVDF